MLAERRHSVRCTIGDPPSPPLINSVLTVVERVLYHDRATRGLPQAPVLRRGVSLASVDPSGETTTLAAVGDAFGTGSRSDVSNWSGGVRAGSGSLVTEDSIHVRCLAAA